MGATKIRIGILGICPVCEGEFKVRDGKLVHHGFTRPGDGQIHGDCFAVGYEPYERSFKGCEDYKAAVEAQLARQEHFLGEIPKRTYWMESRQTWRGAIEVTEYAVGVTSQYKFERFVEDKVRETKYNIDNCKSEIARMGKQIAGWKLADLREVTETMAEVQTKAEREARAAERASKQATKNDKAAALKAKRDAREAKRETAFTAFIDSLMALDKGEPSPAKAREAWYAFFSKRTQREIGPLGDFYCEFKKRGLEDLLVRLQLATREKDGWIRVTYSTSP